MTTNDFIQNVAEIKMGFSPEDAFCILTGLIESARKLMVKPDLGQDESATGDSYIERLEQDAWEGLS